MSCGTREVLTLPPSRKAPARARRAVREFAATVSPGSEWAAELLASELVTNAVMHGHGPVHVVMEHSADGLAVTVVDEAPAEPVVAKAAPGDTSGRGLRLVDVLASEWGVKTSQPGKGVWFRLAG